MTFVAISVCALVYLAAAATARTRGRQHTTFSTVAFVAGLAVLAVALREQWGPYDDDISWVHDVQHALVMCVAPPLLAIGAPITLAVQVLPTRWARRLVALQHARPMRALWGRSAAVHVTVEYYAVMAVYLFTPVHELSHDNPVVHAGTHAVLLTCGLFFWVPIVGVDPVGWRPSRRNGLLLVALGLPVSVVLAVADASWSLLLTGVASTLFGLVLVAALPRRRTVRLPAQRTAPRVAASATPTGQLS